MRSARIIAVERELVLCLTCVVLTACQMVLGFEDHELGAPDAGRAQPAANGGTASVDATQNSRTTGGAWPGGDTAILQTQVVIGGTWTGGDTGIPQTQVLTGGTSTGGETAILQTQVVTGGTGTGGETVILQTQVVIGGTWTGGDTGMSQTQVLTGGTSTGTSGWIQTPQGGTLAANSSETSVSDAGLDGGCVTCSIKSALVHRYSFTGSGARAVDSVGSAHGSVMGTELSGHGTVALNGSGQYIALPSGLISPLTSATFEAWLSWQGGSAWQRIFDFGNSSGDAGVTYLFLTATDGKAGHPRAAYTTSGLSAESRLFSSESLATGVAVQIALSIDAATETFAMFIDGVQTASGPFEGSLAEVRDVNNWLGRSQFSADPTLAGVFDEFRIYQVALAPAQIKQSYELGPNATFE